MESLLVREQVDGSTVLSTKTKYIQGHSTKLLLPACLLPLHGWKRLFKGKVINYEPTCSHKQCDRIRAITTVATLYIPLYNGMYTLGVNLLTKSSHLATKYP